ncbi:MAG: LptF/LptG family permease [Pyrinomonadaceae bacterium]
MRKFSTILARYTFAAILPYFFISWLVLSVIVFVQQAGKHSDLLFSNSIPSTLIWQLMLALIPNVIAFTSPVAALVGVVIGIARMQGDSEVVSIRAAGVGNLQFAIPVVVLGISLLIFALFINLFGVPFAAQIVRKVGIQAAIYKLESPIEPGVFNDEIEGLTIFVKDGDIETGTWKNIFIFQRQESETEGRLITAKEGRIDSSSDNSELSLSGAQIVSLDAKGNILKISDENVQNLSFGIPTKRKELIERLRVLKESPDEMGLAELYSHSRTLRGKEETDSLVLLYRKILLSLTPLLFSLLGFALVTKFDRGGKGFGVFLSLFALVAYYLFALLSEQIARTGVVAPVFTLILPLLLSSIVIIWLLASQRFSIGGRIDVPKFSLGIAKHRSKPKPFRERSALLNFRTRILDYNLITGILTNYILVVGFLSSVFLVFTAFELWKYAGTMENGVWLLTKYLLFLLPFIYLQIAPTALMIATLATYIIKSRRNEIIIWAAAGQSVFRLLLPCLVVMFGVGLANVFIQEFVLVKSNRVQDELRDEIRTGGKSKETKSDKNWISSGNYIAAIDKSASDNGNRNIKATIFQISSETSRVNTIFYSTNATVSKNEILLPIGAIEITRNVRGFFDRFETKSVLRLQIDYANLLVRQVFKPSHLNIRETKARLAEADSSREKRIYAVSIQKKYSALLLPAIISLFSVPFALSLRKQGNVITLTYAIALWLVFVGVNGILEQFGISGYIPPKIAVWAPLCLFSAIGVILLSRVRT